MPRVLLTLLIVGLSVLAFAGQVFGGQTIMPDSASSGTASDCAASGPIVDTIIIDNREVYDTDSPKYDNFLFRIANKLHINTREGVVRRELLFRQGEPLPEALAEESARNIRSRLAVYDAWIETDTLPNGHLRVRVVTIDEWTLSVGPNVRREGNEYRYDFSIVDKNLLGRNQQASARYVFQEIEGDFVDLAYANQRLWGNGLSFDAGYRDDPRDGAQWIRIGHPFYNLSQDLAYGFGVGSSDLRNDVYRDDALIGTANREGDWFETQVRARTGTYYRKLELSSRYEYRFGRTSDRYVISEDPEVIELAESAFGTDSVYHTFELGLSVSNVHFTQVERIDGFSYTEDFTLGQGVGLSFGRSFRPGFNAYIWDRLGFELAQGYRFGSTLAFLSYDHGLWLHGSDEIRHTTRLGGRLYSRVTDYLTMVWRVAYLSDWRRDGAEELVLGGETGLRGYDRYFRTGDRLAITNIEARFFPSIELHSAVFSPVVFTDFGQTWKHGEEVDFDAVHASVGVGLRIALEHSSRERLLRFDFAYSDENGWQLSVSSFHYFGAPQSGFFLTSP